VRGAIHRHLQIQHRTFNDEHNTATVSLLSEGTVHIEYGEVLSENLLVGVFSGTHENDAYLSVRSDYAGYPALGSSIVLFDHYGAGPSHAGELSGQSLTFSP
jgi:hypothetical protein